MPKSTREAGLVICQTAKSPRKLAKHTHTQHTCWKINAARASVDFAGAFFSSCLWHALGGLPSLTLDNLH